MSILSVGKYEQKRTLIKFAYQDLDGDVIFIQSCSNHNRKQ